MTNRTFVTNGAGLGDNPVSIVVTFDGNQIFSGTVPTLSEESSSFNDWKNQLFSWELPISECEWEKPMSIAVSGGDLILNKIQCNFLPRLVRIDTTEQNQQRVNDSQTQFGFLYIETDKEKNITYTDPKIDVKIDGVSRVKTALDGEEILPGEWWWRVYEGSTIEFTLKCAVGPIPPNFLSAL
jgi:hypothetical protein